MAHTHEDIDSKFGRMWNRIGISLEQPTETPFIHGVFVVSNYDAVLRDCLDSNFGNYTKMLMMKYQILFERGRP